MKFLTIIIYIACFLPRVFFAQQLFYSTICSCGVTGNGGSKAYGSDTINLPIQIPPNSSIKKAYLIAARENLADDITVTLNGKNYTFSNTSIITNGFYSYIQQPPAISAPNSGMHALDITNDIDSSVNSYTLFTPPQQNYLKGVYMLFYLYVVFENSSFPQTSVNLILNDQDVSPVTTYGLSNLNPIDNTKPVCFGLSTNHICDTVSDGSYVIINNDTIGLIGGPDLNSPTFCIGPWSNFAHYNDSLFGLVDDTPDSIMAGTDALADIKSYVNYGDTAVNVSFSYQTQTPGWSGLYTNPIRTVMLSYNTPCDTFNTSVTPQKDTICPGGSVQLQATGGLQYSWYGAFGGLSNTSIANPVATPSQTSTYIVTITNDSGCVKTEHVKIWVIPPLDSVVATPTVCGESTGKITAYFDGNYSYSFTLYDSSMQVIDTNSTGVFTQLPYGTYILQSSSQPCTYYDTVTVGYVKKAVASFWRDPYQGQAPLTVEFGNQSLNANGYIWLFPNDTFYTTNLTYTFDTGGVYPVCLVAYNNYPYCADTACYTFVIQDSLQLFAPNVFSPNGDGINDSFTLTLYDFDLNGSITANIYNRWGQELLSKTFQPLSLQLDIWDGTTTAGVRAPEGTYYYVLTYTSSKGEMKRFKGNVTLLK